MGRRSTSTVLGSPRPTRSEPGLLELLSTATVRMAEPRRLPPPPHEKASGLVVPTLLLVCMAVVGLGINGMRETSPRDEIVRTGIGAGEGMAVEAASLGLPRPGSGGFLLTAVSVSRAVASDDREIFEASQRRALHVALRCLGRASADGLESLSTAMGGPSAGLMLALNWIDHLDGRELTAGRRLAGTGALGANGEVLAVGKVTEKARAAEAAHADLFLVPADQAQEAELATGALEVIGVRSVDEAVAALVGNGCRGGRYT